MDELETKKSRLADYVFIICIAAARAFFNEIFIYCNHFAPAGIAGLATMLQYAFNFRAGYFSLLVNIPLLAISIKKLSKSFAAKTFMYIIVFSVANIALKNFDFSGICFAAQDGGEEIMAAIAGGVVGGLEIATCIRLGGCTGGTDIVSAFIHKDHPQFDFVWINFVINAFVAGISFFVYGYKYTPVILCIIYVFTSSKISDIIFKGAKSAIKFEVFTKHPEEMSKTLMSTLKHGCTLVHAEGMYSHNELSLLICVVNKHQMFQFEKIVRQFPDSFAVISSVNSTYGNFKKIKGNNNA